MVIVYFDGYCNLCNGFVDFLIRRDHKHVLKFTSLQGQTAAKNLPAAAVNNLSTMALQEGDRISYESTAALRALAYLGGIYSLAKILLILPQVVRNPIYRLVAKYRYVLFGRSDTCRLPTAQERALFLD